MPLATAATGATGQASGAPAAEAEDGDDAEHGGMDGEARRLGQAVGQMGRGASISALPALKSVTQREEKTEVKCEDRHSIDMLHSVTSGLTLTHAETNSTKRCRLGSP